MDWLKRVLKSPKLRNSLGIIITAAILLELISIFQYHYTRNMLEDELDKRAENEMVMKAILIKGMLNTSEQMLKGHLWNVRDHLDDPEAAYSTLKPILDMHPDILSCGLAFRPNYYPSQGRLFEPFAQMVDGQVRTQQLSGPDHDYTTMEFYQEAKGDSAGHWSDPYVDYASDEGLITSFSMPVTDMKGEFACVLAMDLSLNWLSDTLNARHAYPSSFDLLLTEDGTLICRPNEAHPNGDDTEQVVRLINDSTIVSHVSPNGHIPYIDFTSENHHGDGRIYFHNMKGDPHWQLAVVCYDKEVYGKFDRMQTVVLLSMLGALLLLMFIILRFANNARKLHDATLSQERISSELRIASGLQMSMLPEGDTDDLKRDDVDIHGLLDPAVEVGGDLYDFLIRDEKLFFCIGDVSGKGVPSALVMAVVHALFSALTSTESDPARIMHSLNNAACRNNAANMFVTFFIGVLDLPTGRLRYCNAGHDVPVLMGKEVKMLPVEANVPIGVINDYKYSVQEIVLDDDTCLFLYTDGLTEAMDEQHRQFGIERMLEILSRNRQTDNISLEDLLHGMRLEVNKFVDGAAQSDDLTMMALRYTPNRDEKLAVESLSLKNDLKQVPELNRFVDGVMGKLPVDAPTVSKVKLAVEEAVVNAMNYAYPVGITGNIAVEAHYNQDVVKFVIIDSGKSFDPTKAAAVDTTLSAEDRPIGGLGIFLVRELMDSINYERVGGNNILTLTKRTK